MCSSDLVQQLKQGVWQTTVGTGLHGKTLGVYALGKIGGSVAQVGKAFGMKVTCWGREASQAKARELGYEVPESRAAFFAGADVISLGKCNDLAAARRDYPHLVFQGNVDEEVLRGGTVAEVTAATKACVQAGGGRRHIVNLNHGVDKGTPVANFEAFVRAAKGI